MILSRFATAQDAQLAFYKAIERADLAQMMAVWAEEEEIVCVHPGGPRHSGIEEVRESWRRIFSRGPELKFRLLSQRTVPGRLLSVHSVVERITHTQGTYGPSFAIATNIFVLASHGWQMLVHHASPMPELPAGEEPPSILH
ncbi:MAG: nuclear transport factor 2 family protein [Burkholderiales bacterium]|jgi:ketosteroid isomerase-like protein